MVSFFTLKYMLENKEFVEKTGLTGGLKGKTFVIEGFGSVGYWAAHHLQQAGAILVGVCEHDAQITILMVLMLKRLMLT